MDRFLGDVGAFVEHLGLEHLHLVGHSLGGMVAQRYAVEHPGRLRSLVLASTTSHNGRRASAFAEVMTLLAERGFEAVLADPSLRPEAERALAEAFPGAPVPLEMLKVGVEKPNAARANAWRACLEFSTKDRLGELCCPVLVLHGSLDPLIPFRAGKLVHEAILHSEWLPLEGAGHSVTRERAQEFNAVLVDFLRRAEQSSALDS
jgi:3-oxoadipate enol-lactonase